MTDLVFFFYRLQSAAKAAARAASLALRKAAAAAQTAVAIAKREVPSNTLYARYAKTTPVLPLSAFFNPIEVSQRQRREIK